MRAVQRAYDTRELALNSLWHAASYERYFIVQCTSSTALWFTMLARPSAWLSSVNSPVNQCSSWQGWGRTPTSSTSSPKGGEGKGGEDPLLFWQLEHCSQYILLTSSLINLLSCSLVYYCWSSSTSDIFCCTNTTVYGLYPPGYYRVRTRGTALR